MVNVIIAIAVLAVLVGAVTYIVRAKRRGVKCIGCPHSCSCKSRGCMGSNTKS